MDMFECPEGEQEHLRFINMFAAAWNSGAGGVNNRYNKGIMKHNVIQNLQAVSGDKSLFRQWHYKFITALGQVGNSHEEIVHRLIREIGLGKDMEKVATGLRHDFGEELEKASGDVWSTLIGKAEVEAYDKIKIVPQGQGVVAH